MVARATIWRSKQGRRFAAVADRRGFTLIELLISVVILGVLLAIGVPSFRGIILTNRLKSTSFDVYASIVLARSEAISRNSAVTITPVGGNWTNGWTVTAADGTVIRTQSAYPSIAIGGPASVSFNNLGRTTAAAAQQISVAAADANDSALRCITIDLSGRPTTKSGVC